MEADQHLGQLQPSLLDFDWRSSLRSNWPLLVKLRSVARMGRGELISSFKYNLHHNNDYLFDRFATRTTRVDDGTVPHPHHGVHFRMY